MFGLAFLKLFAVLIDDLLFSEDEEKKQAGAISQEESETENHEPPKSR